MTFLSVNVNKIAVIRNARGGADPSVVTAAQTCIDAGCHGITVHPRPDARHIRASDVHALAELCRDRVEFNIEGNPFAPARGEYPGLLQLVQAVRPEQVTLVPDSDGQITSDHGFDLQRDAERLRGLIAELVESGARVSLLIDPGVDNLHIARDIGAHRVEIYTGPYAQAFASDLQAKQALQDCAVTARAASDAGLEVNAGHDLNQDNLAHFLRHVPGVSEVSIGHALISDALYQGLTSTVERYLAIVRQFPMDHTPI